MSTLRYLGNVNIAIRIVQDKFPEAVLYEVNGSTPDGAPTTNPQDITHLRCVFRNAGGSTVLINSAAAWGEWEEPTLIQHPWLEDMVIPWPIQLDLVEAANLMKAAGYAEPFKNVTLRWPLGYPMPKEPSYIFGLGNGMFIFVGVDSHTVHPGK